MKIKTTDQVLITTGKFKGKTGKVLRVYKKSNRLTVEKINIRTKHIKKTTTRPGEIIRYEAPFSASNVLLLCPNCSKAVRVGYQKKDQHKERICKKCGKIIDTKVAVRKSSTKSK